MLRGASLTNTNFVIAIIVFTGVDTKIIKNGGNPQYKMSRIDAMTNRLILSIIFLQFMMSLLVMIGSFFRGPGQLFVFPWTKGLFFEL